jgi:hypothetical protein
MDIDTSNLTTEQEREAQELLRAAYDQGLPTDFSREGLSVSIYNDKVYLENAEAQLAALNYGDLEIFYACRVCGYESFAEEMLEHAQDEACQDFLRRIGLITEDEEEMRELTKKERVLKVLATHDGLCMDNSDDREELAEALLEMFEIFQEEASMELHITDFSSAMEAIRAGAAWLQGNAERIQEDVGPAVFPDGVYLAGGARYEVKDIAQRILQLADGLE